MPFRHRGRGAHGHPRRARGRRVAAARRAAADAPAPAGILAESAAAWARLWTGDIVVPGQPALQGRVRAAKFYLLASARPDVDWSISPVGLSAGGYNNHVFWDAETWMYPALLAQHPAEASTVVDYRFRTRAGAAGNARRTGYGGLRYAWESALDGIEVTPTWAETGRLEQHVTADVALAQWQWYLATGDQGWLRARGWPVLAGAARTPSSPSWPCPARTPLEYPGLRWLGGRRGRRASRSAAGTARRGMRRRTLDRCSRRP